MAFCSKCGKKISNRENFCTGCGASVNSAISEDTKKGMLGLSKKKLIIISVILVIAAAIIFVLIINAGNKNKSQTAAEILDLGEKYLLEMDYEQAIVAFEKLIEIEPKNPRGYMGLAEAYIGDEQSEKAIEILEQGLKILPDNKDIQRMLEELYKSSNTAINNDHEPSLSSEEKLTDYLNSEVIPRYGLAKRSVHSSVTYDSNRNYFKGGWCNDEVYGIIGAFLEDLNQDGNKELLVFRLSKLESSYISAELGEFSSADLFLDIYTLKNDGSVNFTEKHILSDLSGAAEEHINIFIIKNINVVKIFLNFDHTYRFIADGGSNEYKILSFDGDLIHTELFLENLPGSDGVTLVKRPKNYEINLQSIRWDDKSWTLLYQLDLYSDDDSATEDSLYDSYLSALNAEFNPYGINMTEASNWPGVKVLESNTCKKIISFNTNFDEDIIYSVGECMAIAEIEVFDSFFQDDTNTDINPNNSNSENDSTDYILPDSASRKLALEDLQSLSKEELRLARNEIYARYGRKFTSEDLQNYFNEKNWYVPSIEASAFSENILNEYEKANAELIKKAEDSR